MKKYLIPNGLSPAERELFLTEHRESRLLERRSMPNPIKAKLYEIAPAKLRASLNAGFAAAFALVFNKGTELIEKTYRAEELAFDYEVNEYILSRRDERRSLRRMDAPAKRAGLVNGVFAAAESVGMGVFGIGVPDLPVFVAALLRGVYQTALCYGFGYDSEEERVYILRLIRTALCPDSERAAANAELEAGGTGEGLDAEMRLAAETLSDAVLVEKLVQCVPVVGVAGGLASTAVFARVSALASVKYKLRRLRLSVGRKERA